MKKRNCAGGQNQFEAGPAARRRFPKVQSAGIGNADLLLAASLYAIVVRAALNCFFAGTGLLLIWQMLRSRDEWQPV